MAPSTSSRLGVGVQVFGRLLQRAAGWLGLFAEGGARGGRRATCRPSCWRLLRGRLRSRDRPGLCFPCRSCELSPLLESTRCRRCVRRLPSSSSRADSPPRWRAALPDSARQLGWAWAGRLGATAAAPVRGPARRLRCRSPSLVSVAGVSVRDRLRRARSHGQVRSPRRRAPRWPRPCRTAWSCRGRASRWRPEPPGWWPRTRCPLEPTASRSSTLLRERRWRVADRLRGAGERADVDRDRSPHPAPSRALRCRLRGRGARARGQRLQVREREQHRVLVALTGQASSPVPARGLGAPALRAVVVVVGRAAETRRRRAARTGLRRRPPAALAAACPITPDRPPSSPLANGSAPMSLEPPNTCGSPSRRLAG